MKKTLFILLLGSIGWAKAPHNDPNTVNAAQNWRLNKGAIEHKSNSGKSWQISFKDSTLALRDLHFVDEHNGWAVGDQGLVLHWDGEKWMEVLVFTAFNLHDVYLANERDGWLVGEGGTVLHWDGISWTYIPTPVEESLTKIEVNTDGRMRIVSQKGTILWRENGAWQVLTPTPAEATAQRVE